MKVLPTTWSSLRLNYACSSCLALQVNNGKSRLYATTATKKDKIPTGKSYSDSVNLPRMPFALGVYKTNGQCNEREKYVQELTNFKELYEWQQVNNVGPPFILHDGPPYANGDVHTGHALNKIIKDVINRYKVMRGFKVHYKPGWDCHGLPIENKARQANIQEAMSPVDIRKQAHAFSQSTLNSQRDEFKDWCIMGDWMNPYITSDRKFIKHELHIFQQMYDKGLIYQDYMPVYWSPSSGTALAEAELEYNENHVSQAVYVKLPVEGLAETVWKSDKPLNALIWTTTPWTLPANRAICYSPDLTYGVVRDNKSGSYYLITMDLITVLEEKLSVSLNKICELSMMDLAELRYTQPFTGIVSPLLLSSHVTSSMGTGLVHTAPSHGHDDFKVALKYNMDRSCCVDERGCYTESVGPDLANKSVLSEGNDLVIQLLGNLVVHQESYVHKYPYDWRSKQPVIIRASNQWFIDTKAIVPRALNCLADVKISPEVYRSSLISAIEQRPYWCISRQRSWGVPIPTFYNSKGVPIVHRSITDHVCSLIQSHGCDIWWTASDEELLPKHIRSKAGLIESETYTRGLDILDIWFDSGVTWASVLNHQQADMYIEGVDQIRGWFQSSLLTAVAVTDQAPYKKIMLHGFTVDEEGKKMSKSIGNVIAPSQLIYGTKDKNSPGYGIDVLRWWAANKCTMTNVDIGPAIMKQHNEQMLLLRKRMRFLLGNLYDFSLSENEVPYNEMLSQDQYFLHVLHNYCHQVTSFYENHEMSSVLNELQAFTTKFSNLYSTMCKDRLYCFPADSIDRRSAQTVLYHTLECVSRSFAPILPLFAEDLYHHHPKHQHHSGDLCTSIFRTGWLQYSVEWENQLLAASFDAILKLQNCVKNQAGDLSLEMADLCLSSSNPEMISILQMFGGEDSDEDITHTALCEILQCSSVTLANSNDMHDPTSFNIELPTGETADIMVTIQPTSKHRCQRCRRYTADSLKEPCEMCLLNMADNWS